MKTDWTMFIDGQWKSASEGESITVRNPADGESIATVPAGTAADVDEAVAAAQEAFRTEWSNWNADERAGKLRELADVIGESFDDLVTIETLENGKPHFESENDVQSCIDTLEYFAGAAATFHGDALPDRGKTLDITLHEPYGVVGIILPWNWPTMHVIHFLAPALATGNTVVLKPAPETPLSALRIAELFEEELPAGVFNVVTGDVEPGVRLTEHPGVGKMAFTGNTATGKAVLQAASNNLTSAIMELGGKNAAIVFPDADLNHTVPELVETSFYNSGEACAASERILVHEDVYDEFVERFVDVTKDHVVIGDGSDPETTMGPLISRAEVEKVKQFVDSAIEQGAELLYSGTIPDRPELRNGYFVPPYILGNVSPDMDIFSEEVFGPVVGFTTFKDMDEAIKLANDVRYGLTGSVWTQNGSRAVEVIKQLEVGIGFINNFDLVMVGIPFGGQKESGMGRKGAFQETMREFTQVKSIRFGYDTDTGI